MTIKTHKTMKHLTLFLALGAVVLSSCQNEDNEIVNESTTPVNFTINGQEAITRSLTIPKENSYATAFVANDQIGIYATGAATATNACYTVAADGAGLTGSTVTINKTGNAQFFAYAPYKAEATAEAVAHSVAISQQDAEAYNASNFLTAKVADITAENPNVAFAFNPRLSLVRVEMTGDKGVTTSDVKINAKGAISWNPTTDEVTATGNAADITFYKQETTAEHAVFTAFVPSQTIAGGTQVLIMTVGDKTYAFKPANDVTLTAGAVNKINVKIAGTSTPEITTENIKFSGISVNDWTVNDIVVNDGEIEEVVAAPIELISAADGTFTAETALKIVTGFQGCVVGWNTLNVKDGENNLATIGYDETEDAMKVDIAAGGAWYQKALVYRTPDNAGSLGKYKLSFKVKSTNGKDIIVRVMRGQTKDVFTSNAYFCTGTNGFTGQALAAKTTDAYESKVVNIDLSKITNATTAATAADLATGITISFSTKTVTDAETYYIKDVKLVEVKE